MKTRPQQHYMGLHARCIELQGGGRGQKRIVEALGVSQSTVSRWPKSWREQGQASLCWPKMGGSKRRMAREQDAQLAVLLSQGAVAHGFEGKFWTHRRVAALIGRHFGVSYRDRNTAKVLKRIGYSRQRPQARDYRQDAAKVAHRQYAYLPSDPQNGGFGGAIASGENFVPAMTGTTVYLDGGNDLSVPLGRVESTGGTVVLPKIAIGNNGFIALFIDTEGNKLGFHSMG